MYQYVIKRLIDFIVVFFVLIIVWPVLFLVTFWLYFANKGAGAFFLQERPGRHGKIFKVIKFKTMTDERDAEGNLYLPLYNKEQARRHEVRPGITGWAQVNGRNAISWTRKFELDVWYVDHCSFLLDLKIIFLTIKKVFVREGISSDTCSTMEAFNGNN